MSINNWIINDIFPNLNSGYYLEIVKNDVRVKDINYSPFLKLGWNININYILPRLIVNNNKNIKYHHNQLKVVNSLEKFFKTG